MSNGHADVVRKEPCTNRRMIPSDMSWFLLKKVDARVRAHRYSRQSGLPVFIWGKQQSSGSGIMFSPIFCWETLDFIHVEGRISFASTSSKPFHGNSFLQWQWYLSTWQFTLLNCTHFMGIASKTWRRLYCVTIVNISPDLNISNS